MKTTPFNSFDCVELANEAVSILVTQSIGPRVISLRLSGGENLFAELPDDLIETPGQKPFHFYGGHRLWVAPEWPEVTYLPDDDPVDVAPIPGGISITQPKDFTTGLQKQIQITLPDDGAVVSLVHTLTNWGTKPVDCAPWTITQLKTGGVAILPQYVGLAENQFLPNRRLALWPYADVGSPHVSWGNQYIFIRADMTAGAFKVGFPNPRGWQAYWNQGTLFVKKATYDPQAEYLDFGSSSECYCGPRFIELETLGGSGSLSPGESVTHLEIWEIYRDVDFSPTEASATQLAQELGLDSTD